MNNKIIKEDPLINKYVLPLISASKPKKKTPIAPNNTPAYLQNYIRYYLSSYKLK